MTDEARQKLDKARKTRPLADLRGRNIKDVFGPDISGGCFTGADLSETDWSGIQSAVGLDLRCANLTGANMPNIQTKGWDCTGANMSHVILDGTTIHAIMHSVVLAGASLRNIKWHRGGHAAGRGVILPKRVDFSTWENGRGFHAAIAKVIEQECGGDRGALRACDYILGQSQRCYYEQEFPCWVGFAKMCENELPSESIDLILAAFEKFPNMRLMSMWKWAKRELRK